MNVGSLFKPPHTWKTKEGKVMPIPELTTPHLLNAIALMERRNSTTPTPWTKNMLDELWEEARTRFPKRITKQPEQPGRTFNLSDE